MTPAWSITYGGINITGNLSQLSEHVLYSEAIGGKANTLELLCSNAPRANEQFGVFWSNPPKPGTAVNLSIGYDGRLTNCGLFEIDEWEFTGPPDKFLMRAIQAGVTHPIRTPKSYAWENQSLTSIASTIAGRYGMTVSIDAVDPDVIYSRLTQRLESDLAFLHRIANAHNYEFNVRGNQLVFYSRPQLEAVPATLVIYKTDSTRFRICRQQLGHRSFKSCVVTYFDPLSKNLATALANSSNSNSSDVLKITERIENQQQASIRAQAHLHAANMQQVKAEIVIPGTMLYRAGNTVTLDPSTFGPAFQGTKFIVQEAKHRLSHDGYRTALELRSTISGNASQIISDEYGG